MTISTRPAELRNILGVHVADYTEQEAIDFVGACVGLKRFQPIAFLNANNANIAWRNRDAAEAFGAFVVLPDGIGVDVASKIMSGSPFRANLNGTDFVPTLLGRSEQHLRVGLLGAAPGIAQQAAEAFANIDARHEYRVISHGYFGDTEQVAILDKLRQWKPDILLVALGVPRQEIWICENLTEDHCTVPIAVGALFDFAAGTVPRAPAWVRMLRSEWVYRLMIEPGRLWKRYVLGNPIFLMRVLKQKLTENRVR